MMGERVSCSESFASADISYQFNLTKGGKVFYQSQQRGPFVPSRGVFGNLGRIATQLSFSGGPENEKADLEYLMPGAAKQLSKELQ
jgi:hypothetical protein